MAAYNTRVATYLLDVDVRADTVTGSTAKTLNDFFQTLDSTTGAVQQMTCTPMGQGKVFYTIWYLG